MKRYRNLQVRTTRNYVRSKKKSKKRFATSVVHGFKKHTNKQRHCDLHAPGRHCMYHPALYQNQAKMRKRKTTWSMISQNAKIKVRVSTSMVLPASLSSSFSPKHGITFNPDWRANPTWGREEPYIWRDLLIKITYSKNKPIMTLNPMRPSRQWVDRFRQTRSFSRSDRALPILLHSPEKMWPCNIRQNLCHLYIDRSSNATGPTFFLTKAIQEQNPIPIAAIKMCYQETGNQNLTYQDHLGTLFPCERSFCRLVTVLGGNPNRRGKPGRMWF